MFENERVIIATTVKGKVLAHVRVHQTTLNLIPVLVINNISLKPVREIANPILAVALAGNLLCDFPIGHEEREHGEECEAKDENERDEEVGVERGVDAEERAYDSESGDEDHEEAADEKWVLEDFLAVGAAVHVDVYGGSHGGDAKKQGQDVEGTHHSVAYAEHN